MSQSELQNLSKEQINSLEFQARRELENRGILTRAQIDATSREKAIQMALEKGFIKLPSGATLTDIPKTITLEEKLAEAKAIQEKTGEFGMLRAPRTEAEAKLFARAAEVEKKTGVSPLIAKYSDKGDLITTSLKIKDVPQIARVIPEGAIYTVDKSGRIDIHYRTGTSVEAEALRKSTFLQGLSDTGAVSRVFVGGGQVFSKADKEARKQLTVMEAVEKGFVKTPEITAKFTPTQRTIDRTTQALLLSPKTRRVQVEGRTGFVTTEQAFASTVGEEAKVIYDGSSGVVTSSQFIDKNTGKVITLSERETRLAEKILSKGGEPTFITVNGQRRLTSSETAQKLTAEGKAEKLLPVEARPKTIVQFTDAKGNTVSLTEKEQSRAQRLVSEGKSPVIVTSAFGTSRRIVDAGAAAEALKKGTETAIIQATSSRFVGLPEGTLALGTGAITGSLISETVLKGLDKERIEVQSLSSKAQQINATVKEQGFITKGQAKELSNINTKIDEYNAKVLQAQKLQPVAEPLVGVARGIESVTKVSGDIASQITGAAVRLGEGAKEAVTKATGIPELGVAAGVTVAAPAIAGATIVGLPASPFGRQFGAAFFLPTGQKPTIELGVEAITGKPEAQKELVSYVTTTTGVQRLLGESAAQLLFAKGIGLGITTAVKGVPQVVSAIKTVSPTFISKGAQVVAKEERLIEAAKLAREGKLIVPEAGPEVLGTMAMRGETLPFIVGGEVKMLRLELQPTVAIRAEADVAKQAKLVEEAIRKGRPVSEAYKPPTTKELVEITSQLPTPTKIEGTTILRIVGKEEVELGGIMVPKTVSTLGYVIEKVGGKGERVFARFTPEVGISKEVESVSGLISFRGASEAYGLVPATTIATKQTGLLITPTKETLEIKTIAEALTVLSSPRITPTLAKQTASALAISIGTKGARVGRVSALDYIEDVTKIKSVGTGLGTGVGEGGVSFGAGGLGREFGISGKGRGLGGGGQFEQTISKVNEQLYGVSKKVKVEGGEAPRGKVKGETVLSSRAIQNLTALITGTVRGGIVAREAAKQKAKAAGITISKLDESIVNILGFKPQTITKTKAGEVSTGKLDIGRGLEIFIPITKTKPERALPTEKGALILIPTIGEIDLTKLGQPQTFIPALKPIERQVFKEEQTIVPIEIIRLTQPEEPIVPLYPKETGGRRPFAPFFYGGLPAKEGGVFGFKFKKRGAKITDIDIPISII